MSAVGYMVGLDAIRRGRRWHVVVYGRAIDGTVELDSERWSCDGWPDEDLPKSEARLTDHERAAAVSLIRAQHFAEGK